MTKTTLSRLDSSTFEQLFLEDRLLIDTRAPIEFQRGSFPSAVNIPLMTDDEREQVGICYKEQGEQAALAFSKLVPARQNLQLYSVAAARS